MKKRAFTLIELLIVLVIIGILAALAIPQFEKYVRKAQAADAKVGLRVWADEAWNYYIENGSFVNVTSTVNTPISKYFYYEIGIFSGSIYGDLWLEVRAVFRDYDSLRPGEIQAYGIVYTTADPQTVSSMFTSSDNPMFNKMDDKWYRYYVHKKKLSSNNSPMLNPWTGGWV